MSSDDPSEVLKRIPNLKVVDLRQELEKRGLEKSGLKADLVKRLEKVSFFSAFGLFFFPKYIRPV